MITFVVGAIVGVVACGALVAWYRSLSARAKDRVGVGLELAVDAFGVVLALAVAAFFVWGSVALWRSGHAWAIALLLVGPLFFALAGFGRLTDWLWDEWRIRARFR